MKKLSLIAIILALYAAFGSTSVASAGCKSDCKDQYQSEVDSCHLMYDDPEEADDLRMCLDNAKDEYDSCIEECES